MTGWRRIAEQSEQRHRIDAAIERVLRRRSTAEGITVTAEALRVRDGDFWVRETADGTETHGVWIAPGGASPVLADIDARDGDAAAAWRAISELAAVHGDLRTVGFSAYRGDPFTSALAATAPVRRSATKVQLDVAEAPPPAGIVTRPMTGPEFETYLTDGARGYADELLASGVFDDEAAAMAEAEASMDRLLPDGLDTPGNRLWTVCADDGAPIGILWVNMQEERAFIYDIEMREGARGRGFGTQTLRAAAAHTRDAGLPLLALNVFGSNDAARRLYSREGYYETEVNWAADLEG